MDNEKATCCGSESSSPVEAGCSCSSDSCCNSSTRIPTIPKAPYIAGLNVTAIGVVPRVSTDLSGKDIIGAWRVRFGIGRMNYKVVPGIYSTGKPDENSPVLVTAN